MTVVNSEQYHYSYAKLALARILVLNQCWTMLTLESTDGKDGVKLRRRWSIRRQESDQELAQPCSSDFVSAFHLYWFHVAADISLQSCNDNHIPR